MLYIYYLEESKESIISAFSVIGVCPDLHLLKMKRKGKIEEMYILDNDLHLSLCELANNAFFDLFYVFFDIKEYLYEPYHVIVSKTYFSHIFMFQC